MHKRSLLIGIGIGIIIGAILVTLFDLGENSQQRLSEIDQEINGEGAISPEPTPLSPSEPPINEENATDSNSEQTENVPEQIDNTEVPTESPKVDETAAPIEKEAEHKVSYILRVKPGTTLNEIAAVLTKYNIVQNSDSFVQTMIKNDYLVRAGYFYVEQDSTIEQIVKTLTGTPLLQSERETYVEQEGIEIIM